MNDLAKPLSSRFENYGQSWVKESLWSIGDRVVRVSICCNSYVAQSWRKAELFDGDCWNLIVWHPIGDEFKNVSYAGTMRREWEEVFYKAELGLIAEVKLIFKNHK